MSPLDTQNGSEKIHTAHGCTHKMRVLQEGEMELDYYCNAKIS